MRESRLNVMNESERNSTAAGVAAILRSIAMKQSIRFATECVLQSVPPKSIVERREYSSLYAFLGV